MKKSALLLGGVLPAVHLLRRIQGYTNNIHVIAQKNDAIVYSKYGTKYLYPNPKDCSSTINTWIEKHKDQSNKWLIIPCSEFFIQYIETFRNNGFDVFAPPSQALKIFYDKSALYSWLGSLDIEIAEFKNLNDSFEFTDKKRYIVKCAKASSEFTTPFKTKIINSKSDLALVQSLIPNQYWDNFVVQRMFNNNKSISYGGVWNSGNEIASVIVDQIRQYPQGITSNIKQASDAEDIDVIRKTISKIAENTLLHGFIELEFIKNESGLYPIDLNPRLWGWSNFLFYNFPTLPSSIINEDILLLKSKHIKSWSNIWRDIPAIISSDIPLVSKLSLLSSLLTVSKKDFINLKDIKPEIKGTLQQLKKG